MSNSIKKYIVILLILFNFTGISGVLFSQNIFQKAIGGILDESFSAIEKTADNGFIICGYTTGGGLGGKDILILKTDNRGNLLWAKAFGGNKSDEALHVILSKDNNYIVTGTTYSFGQGDADVFIMKIDNDGNLIWSKTIGSEKEELAFEVVETDKGFLIVGSTKLIDGVIRDAMVIFTDNNGNHTWANFYGESENSVFTNVIKANDGNFIASGSFSEGDIDHYNSKAMKFGENGDVKWYNIYSGSLFEVARSIVPANDGGYVLSGNTNSSGSGGFDIMAFKIDESGKLEWSKVYGGNKDDKSLCITALNNKGYLITGFTQSFGLGNMDVYAVKIDNKGVMQWSKTFGGAGWDGNINAVANNKLRAVISNKDKDFVMADHSKSFGAGEGDIFIVNADTNGNAYNCHDFSPPTQTKNALMSYKANTPDINVLWFVTSTVNFSKTDLNFSDTSLCKCTFDVLLGNDTTLCLGSSVTFDTKIKNASYLWSDNSQLSTLNVSAAGIYTVTVTDKSGCIGIDTIVLSLKPLPVVDLGKDTSICYYRSVTLDAGISPGKYLWNDNTTNKLLNVSKAGKYSVTFTDQFGCSASDSIIVSVYPRSFLNLGIDTTISEGSTLMLDAGSSFINYIWQDSSVTSLYLVKGKGLYWVVAMDEWGCIYSDSININDICDSQDLLIPNCFTPDDDMTNDLFIPQGKCITDFNMKIFNRWGNMIFETNDMNKGWNGYYKNKLVPEGVYAYVISYRLNNSNAGKKTIKRGSVTILR